MPVTRLMTVPQMSSYMDEVFRKHAAFGIELTSHPTASPSIPTGGRHMKRLTPFQTELLRRIKSIGGPTAQPVTHPDEVRALHELVKAKRLAVEPNDGTACTALLHRGELMPPSPFGPLSPAEFQEAVDAPYGKATAILRRHDPMWGRFANEGDKIKWRVRFQQTVTMGATSYVEAATEEEAEALAELIPAKDLRFDEFISDDDGELISVEPA